jgi:hypothetical protein
MRRTVMLLLATIFVLATPAAASAAVPVDPRITAAVAAWANEPLYVDPDYASLADPPAMLEKIRSAPVPVYVAVVPTGAWFQEKDDAELLAGWLANANEKPGLYVVMDGDTSNGVEHEIQARALGKTWANGAKQALSSQLSDYLAEVKVDDRYEAKPARSTPNAPEPRDESEPERFTVGKAIGNGLGAGLLGILGGAILAGVVVGVSALVAGGRGGRS